MGSDYEEPEEPPTPAMPPQWIWLKFLEYRGYTERMVARMSIREVWVNYSLYCFERAYGQLQLYRGGL